MFPNDDLVQAVLEEDFQKLKKLLAEGARVDQVDSHRHTALIIAAHKNFPDVVEALISRGALIDWQDETGSTALVVAVRRGSTKVAQMLLGIGADIHIRDNEGRSALMEAVLKEDAALVQALVDKGARIDETDIYNNTAEDFADLAGKPDILKIFEKIHADAEALRTVYILKKSIKKPALLKI